MIFLHRTCISISYISCKIIHIIDCISEFRNFIDHMMDLCESAKLFLCRFQSHNCRKNCLSHVFGDIHAAFLHSFEDHLGHIFNGLLIKSLVIVPCKSFFVFFHGDFLVFVHKLADRIQRICHICDTKSLRTCEVIDGSAFLNSKSSADAVIYHTGFKRKRYSLCMSNIDRIVCIYKKRNTIFHLLLICIIKLFKSCHLCDVTCLDTNKFSLVHTIGKYKLERTAHIEECCIMPSICLTCLLRLYASDDVIFSGILKSQSSVQKCRDDHLIIIVSRKSDTGSCKLCRLDQKFMRGTIPYTDGKRRHWQMYMHGCKDTHNRKVIGNIISIFILSADNQVLEKAVSCKPLCGSRITYLVEVIQFNPDTVEEFLC